MAKFGLDFTGFLDFARQIDEIGGEEALKEATEKALIASHEYLSAEIEAAMQNAKITSKSNGNHTINWNRTGATKSKFIRNAKVDWDGTIATIGIGFENTPVPLILALGTPHIVGDSKLYKALKGKWRYRKGLDAAQKDAFDKVLKERLRN